MTKTVIAFALSTILFALAFSVEARHSSTLPRIGFLSSSSPSSFSAFSDVFRQGLRDLGYVEEKYSDFEYRYAEGMLDRLPMLAGELVGLKVDVIVAAGGLTLVSAAKKVTDSIPIVMTE